MAEAGETSRSRTTAERIREFVVARFPLARQLAPGDGDSLLESGIVDSLGILELVSFIAEQFGVEPTDEDLTPENFESIENLAAFVERKLGART